jgi:hypothetical protein
MPHIGEYYTPEQLKTFLKDLANFLWKGKHTYDIYIVGGGALAIEYGARALTQDIDGIWPKDSYFKECVRKVADKNGINPDWCNLDFTRSPSYTNAIIEHSHLLISMRGLNVYTVDAELLLCMKLVAGRFKDLVDADFLVGVLQDRGVTVDDDAIKSWLTTYYTDYGRKYELNEESETFIGRLGL